MKVIEFEGIDGVGKTTALRFFADQLKRRGYRVLSTRDNGNPYVPVCVQLREVILNPEHKINGVSMELVFAAMRIENSLFNESVADNYDFILYDRGWLSHLSYSDNNTSRDFSKSFYEHFLANYTHLPTDVIYLDADVEVASSRRQTRNGVIDAIEMRGDEFQRKVRASFGYNIERYRDRIDIYIVDANQNIEGVQEQLLKLIDQYDSLRQRSQ
jgi:dTMP kinase